MISDTSTNGLQQQQKNTKVSQSDCQTHQEASLLRTLRSEDPCFEVFRFLPCCAESVCGVLRSARKIHLVVVPHASSHSLPVPSTCRAPVCDTHDTPSWHVTHPHICHSFHICHICHICHSDASVIMWSTFAKYRKGDRAIEYRVKNIARATFIIIVFWASVTVESGLCKTVVNSTSSTI